VDKTIASGFPLRRCSWAFDPIVSEALGRRMIRWLDKVCLRRLSAAKRCEGELAAQKFTGQVRGTRLNQKA